MSSCKKEKTKSSFLYPFWTNSRIKEKTNKVWSMDKTLVGTDESAGADILKCSVNKVFWKIAQNSLQNTCDGVAF